MRKIVGIIGYPLGHTLSPAMHNAAYKELGLDYEYIPFEVHPDDLKEAVNGFRAINIAGFNVTIPHKERILPLLDEVTKLAKVIGAVNTVENQDGRLVGYNTDAPGFIESLKEELSFDPKGKGAVILGAGGASRAVAVILAECGAKTIVIADAIEEKAKSLAAYIDSDFEVEGDSAALNSIQLKKAIEVADLLVNASPIGMKPNIKSSPLPNNVKLNKHTVVYDLVYNPAETALVKSAKQAGCKATTGLGMLVRQGALAFSIFTGEEPPLEIMWSAAKKVL